VTALLEASTNPNARDDDGKLPFDCARNNEKRKGTDGCRNLDQARFQLRVNRVVMHWAVNPPGPNRSNDHVSL